jgi:membrane fusion protein, multidrug efflux system
VKVFLKVILTLACLVAAGWGTVHFVQKAQAEAELAKVAADAKAPAAAKPVVPLLSQGYKVKPEVVPFTISAIGSLVANESVEITNEQSRRLIAIHVEEGENVEKDELLFELDSKDDREALAEIEARRELAILNEGRLRQLVQSQSSSQAEYDQVRSELDVVNAQLEQVKTQIEKSSIRAPFAGRVGLRRVSLGAWLETNTVLVTLQDLSRMKVDFKIPERYAAQIARGLDFNFRPDGSGELFSAKVIAVEPAIDSQTRSLIVRGLAENSTGKLLPGAFVKVELSLSTDENDILIPTEAIVPSAKGTSVFVVEEGKAAVRLVELGVRLEDKVQVLSGLKADDVVLTTNLLRLRPGSAVTVTTDNE